MNADLINGIFETLAGTMISLHCWRLYKDKLVRGVSLVATVFFCSWGVWNIYFYPHLNQWWSFAGGLVVVLANCVWVGMMIYYKRSEKALPTPDALLAAVVEKVDPNAALKAIA